MREMMVQQQWISGVQKVEQTKSADSLDVRYVKKLRMSSCFLI